MQNTRLEVAKKYLARDWNVIPLGIKLKKPDFSALKSTGHGKPDKNGNIVGGWESFQTERTTNELLEAWWTHSPQSNIGIVTGKISSLIVVDIDPKNGGNESFKKLHLPPTYIVKTGGGGAHYYYKWTHETPPPNLKGYLFGVDIQGEGAYVVAPPSIHPEGEPYEAVNEIEEITDAPDWLFNLQNHSKEKLWELGSEGVSEGSRNATAASVTGKLLSSLPKLLWDVAGWGGLKEWNTKNPNPLSETELRCVFESIKKQAKEKPDDDDEQKGTAAKQIVELVLKGKPTLVHDILDIPYARLEVGEHKETHPIHSQQFRQLATRQYWLETKKAPKSDVIKQALDVLGSSALFDGEEVQLAIRVTEHKTDFWYDLCDKEWQAIQVTPAGWEVIKNPPIIFKRHKHMKVQCMPSANGNLSSLLGFVNISDKNQQLLLQVYLVSCFIPNIPHPIPVLHGSQGSAKSTFLRVIRRIIDPSAIELLSFPTQQTDLIQQLSHHWTPYYDNVTTIPDWLSDILCRAVTGAGFSKRELYTNDDDAIYAFQCCIGINGINIAATKADLLERSILFNLERISKENRLDERSFWNKFEEERPNILGGVFDVLSKAMTIYPTIKLNELPRMADFALWGCAISQALGYTNEDFLRAYGVNINEQNEEAIKEHPVATLICVLMQSQETWTGTSTQLLSELNALAISEQIDIRQRLWPKAANTLTKRLKEAKTNLENTGISIDIGKGSSRSITIRKHPKNTVDAVESSLNDALDALDGISGDNSLQETINLIHEHFDPNAHLVEKSGI